MSDIEELKKLLELARTQGGLDTLKYPEGSHRVINEAMKTTRKGTEDLVEGLREVYQVYGPQGTSMMTSGVIADVSRTQALSMLLLLLMDRIADGRNWEQGLDS